MLINYRIEYLSMKQNKFSVDICNTMSQLLSHIPFSLLKQLNISSTNSTLKFIFNGLSTNNQIQLTKLDVSQNKLVKHEDIDSLCEYLQKTNTLQQLSLASTQLPCDMLEKLLTSINNDIELSINLSNNNFGINGAKILGKIVYKLNNISSLNLSDNDMGDEGVMELTKGLRNNYSIKRLILNRNFKGKTKYRNDAINNLIKLISSECSIEG